MRNSVNDRPDELRRKLLKSSALLGGAFAAAHAMPYVKPGSKSFAGIPSAYAMLSGSYLIPSCTAEDPGAPFPGEVLQTGTVTNITATVTPIPPSPLEIDCVPTSTDPANPAGNQATAFTDPVTGVATFPDFDMTADWPAPLLPVDTLVTFTHSFVDPACGPDTCPTNLIVVGPPFPPVVFLTGIARGLDPPDALHQNGVLILQATATDINGDPLELIDVEAFVTTDDPANPTVNGNPLSAVTDASGDANFLPLTRMGTDFPNPPLPFGTIVSIRFKTISSVPVSPTDLWYPALHLPPLTLPVQP